MSIFRNEMRKSRAILHRNMGDRALVFTWPPERDEHGEIIAPVTTAIKVRVHEKFVQNGDLKGTNFHYAEVEDNSPIAVFWLDEPTGFAPKRGLVFTTEYGKAYRIDTVHPEDDQTQNADIVGIDERDTTGMPFPE